jgi:hypothetical protein
VDHVTRTPIPAGLEAASVDRPRTGAHSTEGAP